MALADHQFDVRSPTLEAGAWWYAVEGTRTWRHGPFATAAAAWADVEARFGAWRRRARALGGWAWRRTQREWVVTVPASVEVPGRPLERAPCTRHGRGAGAPVPTGGSVVILAQPGL